MITMILISSVAMLVGIVGSVLIWGYDASRAEEIAHTPVPADPAALSPGPAQAAVQSTGDNATIASRRDTQSW